MAFRDIEPHACRFHTRRCQKRNDTSDQESIAQNMKGQRFRIRLGHAPIHLVVPRGLHAPRSHFPFGPRGFTVIIAAPTSSSRAPPYSPCRLCVGSRHTRTRRRTYAVTNGCAPRRRRPRQPSVPPDSVLRVANSRLADATSTLAPGTRSPRAQTLRAWWSPLVRSSKPSPVRRAKRRSLGHSKMTRLSSSRSLITARDDDHESVVVL